MILRVPACALAAVGVLVASGCGGSGNARSAAGTSTTLALPTTTVHVTTPAVQPACRRLNQATRQALQKIAASAGSFRAISGPSSLSRTAKALRQQIDAQSRRIDGVQTPAGPLTQDKQRIAAALHTLATNLAQAQQAAQHGKVGTAAHDLASLARLQGLRRASTSLARDCPQA